MIYEKGLCAAMKAAWRTGGYEVAGYGEGNTLFINGYGWCAAAPMKQMPRKVLALLVEHVGMIPMGDGEPDLFGNALIWDEGGELVVVLPGSDAMDTALRELLEQTMLAGE